MADITMCRGYGCLKKESCYRYITKPNKYRQAYFIETPQGPDGKCDYFWPIPGEFSRMRMNRNK